MPEVLEQTPEVEASKPYMSPEDSSEILVRAIQGTRRYNSEESDYNRVDSYVIGYDDLVGREKMIDWHQDEREAAQTSVAVLVKEVLTSVSKDIGPSQTYEEALDAMVKVESATKADATGREFAMGTYLKAKGTGIKYQNMRAAKVRESLDDSKIGERISESTGGDWLHFGADKPIDPLFSERVRVYFNPGTALAGQVAAEVAKGFREHFGYVPRGKIWDCSASSHPSRRHDSGLFWAHSPEELTFIVSKLDEVSKVHPEWFGVKTEKPSVLLGEKIAIPTVSIAQEPSREMKDRDMDVSYNTSRESMLGQALGKVLNAKYDVQEKILRSDLPALAEEFSRELKLVAAEQGANEASFAFNADQDMDIIAEAVAKGLGLAA